MNVKPLASFVNVNGFSRPVACVFQRGDLVKVKIDKIKNSHRVISREKSLCFGKKMGVIRSFNVPTEIGKVQETRQNPHNKKIFISVSFPTAGFLIKFKPEELEIVN